MPTKQKDYISEIGEIGIKSFSYGGSGNIKIDDETLELLRGDKKYKWYKEMVVNDPFIGANYKMTTILGAKGEWSVKEGSDSLRDRKASEFIRENLFEDLEGDFSEFVKFTLGSMFTYGFSLSEIVLKKRKKDGRYVLKKLAKRLASTTYEWIVDNNDNINGIVQQDPNNLNKYTIPYNKLLHCKLDDVDGSYEGIALTRNCFPAYYTKKFIESQERIRVSKDARGNIVAKVPATMLSSKEPKVVDLLEKLKKSLSNISNAKDTCMLFPSEEYYDLDTLKIEGDLTKDTSLIIDRCDRYIATNLLSDFLLLGLKSGGTGGLIQPKIRIFSSFVASLMDIIKYQVNKKLIPILLEVNNIKYDKLPYLQHENLSELLNIEAALLIQSAGQWIRSIGNAEQYNYLMKKFMGAGFPTIDENSFNKLKNELNKSNATTNNTSANANSDTKGNSQAVDEHAEGDFINGEAESFGLPL